MRNTCVFVCALLLCLVSTPAKAEEHTCVSASTIAKSVLRINRYMVDEMQQQGDIQGTIFMVSETDAVSVGHLVLDLQLSRATWTNVTLYQERVGGYYETTIFVRVKEKFSEGLPYEDGLYLLELQRPYPGDAEPLPLRMTALTDAEHATAVGYTFGELSMAWGHFLANPWHRATLRYGGPEFASFELVDEFDRSAIFVGASGGPIVDCHGAVIGVIARVPIKMEQAPGTVRYLAREFGIPVLRGKTNVWAVPTFPIAETMLRMGY